MMRIYHIGPYDAELTLKDASIIRHLHVRRIQKNETIELLDGKGHINTYLLISIDKSQAVLKMQSTEHIKKPVQKTLMIALCRFKTLEIIAQKACELGVTTIQPLLTDNVGNVPSRLHLRKKMARIEEIMQQSLGQCGNPYLPIILPMKSLLECDPNTYTLADANGNQTSLEQTSILIGPEGGFSEKEYSYFQKNAVPMIRFPGHILRAETAAIIAMHELNRATDHLDNNY